MNNPLIGVTGWTSQDEFSVRQTYLQAIIRAGGAPLIIPPTFPLQALDDLLSRLDGVLLTGGGDIDPARFNGQPHPEVYEVDPQRDELELRLASLAAGRRKPLLGICRGLQVLNVALGGSLLTHISEQKDNALKHDYYPNIPRDYLAHSIYICSNTRLLDILGTAEIEVNSLHHQGIERLAAGLHPVAFAPDGLIEAVELPDSPFGMGVQWHPECLPDSLPMRALFQAFIEAAR